MPEDKKNITYETLFEILRHEKNKAELQKLDKDFFKNTSIYIKEKELMFKAESEDNYQQQQIQLKQLSNIKKIFRDIYFRRMKKIISNAFSLTVTSDSIAEKSSMLKQEKEFFLYLSKVFIKNRSDVLDNILSGKEPSEFKVDGIEFSDSEKDEDNEEQEEPKEINGNFMVRFLKDVPKFVGEDLEHYGPYNEDDIATVPKNLADILIKKESVEVINSK
ncbi:MAG: hypothetical protein ACOC1K_05205 [Nanoarchaeota archaeon]